MRDRILCGSHCHSHRAIRVRSASERSLFRQHAPRTLVVSQVTLCEHAFMRLQSTAPRAKSGRPSCDRVVQRQAICHIRTRSESGRYRVLGRLAVCIQKKGNKPTMSSWRCICVPKTIRSLAQKPVIQVKYSASWYEWRNANIIARRWKTVSKLF